MKDYISNSNKKRNTQKVSLLVAVALCVVSMFGIAMIYKNAIKKQEDVRSLIETEDTGESDLAKLEEDLVSFTAQPVEENLEVEEAGVVDASRREEVVEDVYVENIEVAAANNHFNEASRLTWPVQGEVLMEYSMEAPVYYQTLEQFGYSTGMVIQSERGQLVHASADGTVTDILYTDEYGWTVEVDLGDGYKATYGQLADIQVAVGDSIVTGAVIAEVAVPSKNFSVEGDNVYFSLEQNETSVDPLDYLE